ncbi:MAG: HU family DNA-binding protein [Clostridiales bacterium]|nr:HU family DNA-binding protein [Candidatus Crickella caballi]
MNKAELVTKVADNTNFKKKDVEATLDAVLEVIQESLVSGESVKLIGFGTFETRSRKARMGRNPQKPENLISIPASKAPVFKAGKSLKDAVNK